MHQKMLKLTSLLLKNGRALSTGIRAARRGQQEVGRSEARAWHRRNTEGGRFISLCFRKSQQ